MAAIPKFKNLQAAADFWDTHDFEDFVEDTVPVVITVKMPPGHKTLQVDLDAATYEQITALAAKRHMRADKLVSAWLKEKATVETARK